MNKLLCLFAAIMFVSFSSCQKRVLCKIKTATGGTAFTRIYANTYSDEEEYYAAIDTLKSKGYACDDSAAALE
jgi:hypothetical protein